MKDTFTSWNTPKFMRINFPKSLSSWGKETIVENRIYKEFITLIRKLLSELSFGWFHEN